MTTRQYVQVQFNPWDRRSYTYHNDGPPVAVGNTVMVETAKGKVPVTVTGLTAVKPAFATKPILGPSP